MMVNVYDSANKLAEDLTQTDQYKALQKAIKDVEENDESSAMFKKMDELQAKILRAQQAGQPLAAEDQQAYKDLNDQVQKNDLIVNMLKSEQALYDLLNDIQRLTQSQLMIFMKTLETRICDEIYSLCGCAFR